MKIKSQHLQHFRRFEDFKIDFHPQLTVLVAKNGAGKTSILDGLAVSLGAFLTRLPKVSGLNFKDADFQVNAEGGRPPFMRVSCETVTDVQWDRTEKRDQAKKTIKAIPTALGLKPLNDHVDPLIDAYNEQQPFVLPIFIYYGTGRGVFDIPQRKRGFLKTFTRFDAFKGALEARTNFKSFVEYFYWLEDVELKRQKQERSFDLEIPELKAIRAAVKALMPEFSNPRGSDPAGIEVDWQQGENAKTLKIEQLSDGYRITLAMVMDIAARMAEANPDSSDPLQTEGVVMIDEVDLHLHPGWQQTILLDLMRTFPNVQFIVSTHSPQVISSVKPECLRVIDWQNDKPKLLDIPFSGGAEAQQVLLQILGVESPRVEALDIVKDLHKYQQMVNNDEWDTEEAQTLRNRLDRWGAGHEPELIRLDMDICMKKSEREQK